MQRGDIVAERFEIEALAGAGGMGAVYRALDRTNGTAVALKVLTGAGGHAARFGEESRLLGEIAHPAVVRYVSHGVRPDGAPYLAMEWLEGEDLATRLARAPLTLS